MSNVAHFKGYIKASASIAGDHPLQSRVTLILTDFEPNLNKQGIPRNEKVNIMRSALNMPLKINFDGEEFYGHAGAIPLGPIVRVWEDTHNGRDVIKGEAIIWIEHYKDIRDHLVAMFEEGFGTSWEVYYADSEVDDNGVEWLHDTIFAGTCVVDTPAYGPERTRVLAISSYLKEHDKMPKNSESETEAVEAQRDEEVIDTPHLEQVQVDILAEPAEQVEESEVVDSAQASEWGDEARNDISEAQSLLFQIYEGLEQLYAQVTEVERAQVTNDIGTIAQRFADMIDKIAGTIADMKAEKASLQTKVTELEQAEAERKAAAEKAELLIQRRAELATAGVKYDDSRWEERAETIAKMDESTFKLYVADMASVAVLNKGTAEVKNPLVPEPMGQDTTDTAELKSALKDYFKR